jgi:hypothetical protein
MERLPIIQKYLGTRYKPYKLLLASSIILLFKPIIIENVLKNKGLRLF